MATFSASTEAWRPLLEAGAGDLPIDFLLAWIERESGGNACSYTAYRESGIFQLMPPDNTNIGGTTEAALRTMCVAGTSQFARPMTADEMTEQVRSGVQYVNYARDVAHQKLDEVGADWPETSPDFWMMTKLYHTLPSLMGGLKAAATDLGRAPSSWAEFRPYALKMNGGEKWLPNAEYVGQFGQGGGRVLTGLAGWAMVAFIGTGIGMWLAGKLRHVPL